MCSDLPGLTASREEDAQPIMKETILNFSPRQFKADSFRSDIRDASITWAFYVKSTGTLGGLKATPIKVSYQTDYYSNPTLKATHLLVICE